MNSFKEFIDFVLSLIKLSLLVLVIYFFIASYKYVTSYAQSYAYAKGIKDSNISIPLEIKIKD